MIQFGNCICCRSNQTLGQFVPTQVNLFQPRSTCFNLGQFVSTQVNLIIVFFLRQTKKYFWHLRSSLHLPSSLYLPSTYLTYSAAQIYPNQNIRVIRVSPIRVYAYGYTQIRVCIYANTRIQCMRVCLISMYELTYCFFFC